MSKKIFLLTLLLLPLVAFSQAPTEGLVPEWCQAGCPCTFCDLYDLASNIIGFLLYVIAVPVAAGAFLYGGVLMLTSGGNPSQITKGRGMMTSAVIGMALAFFAWAILNTILATIGFGIGNAGSAWYQKLPCEREGGTKCNINLGDEIVAEPPRVNPPAPTGQGLSHEEAANYLRGAGIAIESSGDCEEYRTGCTYLGGLSLETINRIIQVDAGCSGCVTITGGTEPGHDSHGPDHPTTIDMEYSSAAVLSLSANGVRKDANFGQGFTCEGSPGKAVPCDSDNIHHIHVQF